MPAVSDNNNNNNNTSSTGTGDGDDGDGEGDDEPPESDGSSSEKKETPPTTPTKSSCSSKASKGGDDCCSSKKKETPAPVKSSCSSKASKGGDDCCASKKETPAPAKSSCSSSIASKGGDDCCASKAPTPAKSSCSSGKASKGGDDCGASKKETPAPAKSSCSSGKASKGGDDCCASKKETPAPAKSSCSSGKASKGGDDCGASKKETPAPAKSSCSSGKASKGGDDCCASKKETPAPAKSSCSSGKASKGGDDCGASKKETPAPAKSSCSSGKASKGGDDCCASKAPTPAKSSCSSGKASKGGDDCGASKKETPAPAKSSCSSGKASKGGDDCCASKAPTPTKSSCSSGKASNGGDDCCAPHIPAKSSCSSGKASKGGDDCCAPKAPAPSKSSCSSKSSVADDCCAPSPNGKSSSCSSAAVPGRPAPSKKKKGGYGSTQGSINSIPAEKKRSSWFSSWFGLGESEDEEAGEKQPLLKGNKSGNYGGPMEGEESIRLTLDIEGMTCDGCGSQIVNFLLDQPGIEDVSVAVLTKRGTFDYYPSRISEDEIIANLRQLGFTPTVVPNSTESSFHMRVHCGSGAGYQSHKMVVSEESVRSHLVDSDGVSRVNFVKRDDDGSFLLYIVYDIYETSTRALIQSVESLGKDLKVSLVSARSLNSGSVEDDQIAMWKNSLFITIALGLPVVALSVTESVLGHALWSATVPGLGCLRILDIIQFVLATIVQFWIGKEIYERAWSSVYFGGRADMDVLIACSTTVAWTYSTVGLILDCVLEGYVADLFFDTCVILMALIILGRYLEIMAKGEASKKLNSILSLQSPTAILYDEYTQNEQELDVELICHGDLVKVQPGMTVPLDGLVFQGETTINESMVTGESIPVTKRVRDPVLGGTINQDGLLLIRVTKIHSEGTLAQMHTLMEEAQHQKPKAQRVADTVASYFVPIIIGLSVLIFVMWYLMCFYGIIDAQEGLDCVTFSLKFMITMLIISCPCAIALAAPTPLVVAAGMAAKLGAVLKSSITFETLQKVDTLVVDKTGTLTWGELVVNGVGVAPGISMEDFLWLCGSAESGSEHPIGKALTQYAREHVSTELSLPGEFEAKRGAGLYCNINGKNIRIGASVWLDGEEPGYTLRHLGEVRTSKGETYREMEADGLSVIFVEIEGKPMGFFGLSDHPKPHVKCVIEACDERGVAVYMLSGDSEAAVRSLGRGLGMDPARCLARHTPEMKSEVIARLQKEGRVVAFVGDGVNDSIALAQADVGIAVNEGTSIAIEAADLVLMRDDLWILVQMIDLSRATYRLIKFNFMWAFLYNLVALPLSGGLFYPFTGFQLPPFYAGFAEMLSSLPVIGFSLMLKYYSPEEHPYCQRFPAPGSHFEVVSLNE